MFFTTDTSMLSTVNSRPGGLFEGKTHYVLSSENFGSDEPLVICVHGLGSYYAHYDLLTQALKAESFTVLTFDLMGRGYSPYPDDDTDSEGYPIFGAESHVKQMRELIVGLGFDKRKYHVVGHSMGGAIAALYTSKFGTDEVLSLTLLSPAGLMDGGLIKFIRRNSCLHGMVRRQLQSGSRKTFENDFYGRGPVVKASVEDMLEIQSKNPHIFEAVWNSILQFPFADLKFAATKLAQMHNIRIMVMWADKDKAVPLSPNLRRWKGHFEKHKHPSVEYKVFQRACHGFFIEFADEFNADMIRFLKGGANPLVTAV